MHSGALKLPKKAPSAGIQLPKRQSQSIGDLAVCIVIPSLPVKEASLMEVCSTLYSSSTETERAALLLMKSTPAMERDSLPLAETTPPFCGCEERAG